MMFLIAATCLGGHLLARFDTIPQILVDDAKVGQSEADIATVSGPCHTMTVTIYAIDSPCKPQADQEA